MSAGFMSKRELTKAHLTRKAKRAAAIGTASPESIANYRTRCKGAVNQEKVAQNEISIDNTSTSSDITPALNLLPTGSEPIQLFPPAQPINLQIAYERFQNTPTYLEDAACKGQQQVIEHLQAEISRYQAANSATSGTIWFRAVCYGKTIHYVYNPTANRLERVLHLNGRMMA